MSVVKPHFNKNKVRAAQINGLCMDESGDNFLTCGDDGYLKIWSTEKKACLVSVNLNIDKNGMLLSLDPLKKEIRDSAKLKSIDINKEHNLIAVGCRDGTLRIVSNSKWTQIYLMKNRKSKLNVVKFSPDEELLAVGSHEGFIDIYNIPSFKHLHKLKKNSFPITHIDWSNESNYIQAVNSDLEMIYFDIRKGIILPQGALMLRDESWADWTLPIGWPVQGIYSTMTDHNSISCTHRSFLKEYCLLAAGNCFNDVKIFNYPSVNPLAKELDLKGHSSKISSLKFNIRSNMLVSIGSDDLTILQWKIIYGVSNS